MFPKMWANVKEKTTVKLVFMWLVIIMWTISFLTDIANPKYDPPEYVNPLIMLVGGYLMATATTKEKK